MSRNYGIQSGRVSLGGMSTNPATYSATKYERADLNSVTSANHPPCIGLVNSDDLGRQLFIRDGYIDERELGAWCLTTAVVAGPVLVVGGIYIGYMLFIS